MNTAVATQDTNRNVFEAYSEAANPNRIVGDLLKFTKGHYYAGQNEDEIPVGARFVANMDQAMVGWVRWEGGKPTDMQMGRIAEGFVPLKRNELGDVDQAQWERDDQGQARDPWQLTNYLILKDVEADAGLYTFASSSKGGINAIGRLCGLYGKQMRQKPDQFPVIALNIDSYKHPNKAYGKIFTPQFDIEGWAPKSVFDEEGEASGISQTTETETPKPAAAKSKAGAAKSAETQF